MCYNFTVVGGVVVFSLDDKKFLNIDVNRLLFLISVALFVILSISNLSHHIPWADEVNAWNIAGNVSFLDLFKLAKYEGHMFVWFTILMPFAKHNLFFPNSLLAINWIFVFLSVLVLWRFAPFNSLTKTFLTFSFPIMMYSYLARCYSIGVLLFFCIAALYPKRLKHPLWYSLLIILVANTSVMALMGAFALGLIFLLDLYQNRHTLKKNAIIGSISIFALGATLILTQLLNFQTPYYAFTNSWNSYRTFLSFMLGRNSIDLTHVPLVISYSILLISSCIAFRKDIKIPVFLFITQFSLLIIFSKIYSAEIWHFAFIFIYLILAVWIYFSEHKPETNFQKCYKIIFLLFVLSLAFYKTNYITYNSDCIDFRNYVIENIQEYQNAKIFVYPDFNYVNTIYPYLTKYNIKIYNSHADAFGSFDFFAHQWDDEDIDFIAIKKVLAEDEFGYILVRKRFNDKLLENIKQNAKEAGLKAIPYYCVLPVYIYKVEKIKN